MMIDDRCVTSAQPQAENSTPKTAVAENSNIPEVKINNGKGDIVSIAVSNDVESVASTLTSSAFSLDNHRWSLEHSDSGGSSSSVVGNCNTARGRRELGKAESASVGTLHSNESRGMNASGSFGLTANGQAFTYRRKTEYKKAGDLFSRKHVSLIIDVPESTPLLEIRPKCKSFRFLSLKLERESGEYVAEVGLKYGGKRHERVRFEDAPLMPELTQGGSFYVTIEFETDKDIEKLVYTAKEAVEEAKEMIANGTPAEELRVLGFVLENVKGGNNLYSMRYRMTIPKVIKLGDEDQEQDQTDVIELERDNNGELSPVRRLGNIYLNPKQYANFQKNGVVKFLRKLQFVCERKSLCSLNLCAKVSIRSSFIEPETRKSIDLKSVVGDFCVRRESDALEPAWKISLKRQLVYRNSTQHYNFIQLVESQTRLLQKLTHPKAYEAPQVLAEQTRSSVDLKSQDPVPKFHRSRALDIQKQAEKLPQVDPFYFEGTTGDKLRYYVHYPKSKRASARSENGPASTAQPSLKRYKYIIILIPCAISDINLMNSLAADLSSNYGHPVFVLDRHTCTAERAVKGKYVFIEDIRSFVRLVSWNHESSKLILTSFSGGCTSVLQYARWKGRAPVHAYCIISPFLADLLQEFRRKSIKVNYMNYLGYLLSGGTLCKKKQFVDAAPALPDWFTNIGNAEIASIPCCMSSMVRLPKCKATFAALDRPYVVFVGSEDEVVQPSRVLSCTVDNSFSNKEAVLLEGYTHVDIISVMGLEIDKWLKRAKI
eukprot:Nk52_evm3s382 gene=Nk52_evmTU3s382